MIGKMICDLAPSDNNERNSEGAFIRLKDGSLLFVYTRYRNAGWDDHCTADLYGILSTDEGETFGTPFLVLSCDAVGADNVMSVSLIRMKNGDIGLFYLQKHMATHSCVPYFTTSADEGKTWGRHIRCIEEDGYYVLNNDRVIVLKSGRILVPVSKHTWCNGAFMPGSVYIYASDDEGLSWYALSSEIVINPAAGGRKNFSALHNGMEPGLLLLEDGRIWCYIRTALGRQYETFSEDEGATWCVPQPSPFTAPDSPMCVKSLKNGDLFAVWNPIPVYMGKDTVVDGVWTGARAPLVYALLDKEGNLKTGLHEIETDETCGFCYCAIHETEKGDLLLGYCAGGTTDRCCLNRLRIRKLYRGEIDET